MSTPRLPLLVLLSTIIACASSQEQQRVASNDGVASDVVLKDGPVTDGVQKTSTKPRVSKGPAWPADAFILGEADKRNAQIGAPCEGAKPAPNGAPEAPTCGLNGTISVENDPQHPAYGGFGVKLNKEPPCQVVPVAKKDANRQMMGMQPMACVVGDEILASVECMMCRVPGVGSSVHGRISEMTAEQHRHVFAMLQLEGDVPTDAASWQKAIANSKVASAN